jgi:methylated-DNA-[protein]-cysteine S-methyltransferase
MLLSHQRLHQGPSIQCQFYIEDEKVQKIDLYPIHEKGLEWQIFSSSSSSLVPLVEEWLMAYVDQRRAAPFPLLNWEVVSSFTQQVLQILHEMPFGTSLSYSQIANLLHKPQAARAVGGACGRNPFLLMVPCHRILANTGAIGGFSAGLEIKKRLLQFESIPFFS